ncbi:uncharacterized protein LOC107200415 [Parus major]|uniref:uncharacterized protein LOC107200415 n=1 Tax=Parus major TaxID=9157 RepID=UPI00077107EE|nr:uncharacterized protein LOC107200415 [Parus major]
MAGKITKILLVLAVLHYALRASAQAAQTTAEVLTQQEEQQGQMSWLARAGKITKILVLLGILKYTLRVDVPTVRVTEEVLKQHEKERIMEMTQLLAMEQRIQKQRGFSPGRMLLLACQEWQFWVGAEILLVLFGVYWLPRQSNSDCDDDSQWETTSAQEQTEDKEEEESCEDNPDSHDKPEKPPDKSHCGGSSGETRPWPWGAVTGKCAVLPPLLAEEANKSSDSCFLCSPWK